MEPDRPRQDAGLGTQAMDGPVLPWTLQRSVSDPRAHGASTDAPSIPADDRRPQFDDDLMGHPRPCARCLAGCHTGDLVVRLAEPDDVEPVLDLLAEAGDWVRAETGISQWPKRFPREFMIDLVDRGVLYVANDDTVLAATLCLQWADPTFWPGAADDAVYVHRLAVKRSCAGRGIGERLLHWAAERAVEGGRAFVRVDCMTENAGLRRYYESLGFRHRGDVSGDNPAPFNVTFRSRWYASQYEKPVASLPHPHSPWWASS